MLVCSLSVLSLGLFLTSLVSSPWKFHFFYTLSPVPILSILLNQEIWETTTLLLWRCKASTVLRMLLRMVPLSLQTSCNFRQRAPLCLIALYSREYDVPPSTPRPPRLDSVAQNQSHQCATEPKLGPCPVANRSIPRRKPSVHAPGSIFVTPYGIWISRHCASFHDHFTPNDEIS